MARLFRKIVLLSKKNVKVRFSYRCLTFCELLLPLIITAIPGLIVSYNNVSSRRNDEVPSSVNDTSYKDIVESRFHCEGSDIKTYNCEKWYPPVTSIRINASLKPGQIVYVIADSVQEQEGGLGLAVKLVHSAFSIAVPPEEITEQFRLEIIKTERELEICVVQKHSDCENITAVVVITDVEDRVKPEKRVRIKYKIRVTELSHLGASAETHRLFSDYNSFDLEKITSDSLIIKTIESFYLEDEQFGRRLNHVGFVYIQAMMDRGITRYVGQARNDSHDGAEDEISLVRMPFVTPGESRPGKLSRFLSMVYSLLASLAIFCLMRVNSEKSSGFKELLRMHGVTLWTQWMGWLLSSFLVYLIWTLLLTLLVWLPLLGGSNMLVVTGINVMVYWMLLFLFMMALTTFSYLVSVFFERVWTAASVGLLAWIVLTVVMMDVSAAFYSVGTGTKIGWMLVPTVAFDFAFRLLINGGGKLATVGVPVLENVPLTVLHCLAMLLLDSCIFMTLTIYLDNVLPSKYGVTRSPWYIVENWKRFFQKVFKNGGIRAYKNADDFDGALDQSGVELTPMVSMSQNNQYPFEADPDNVEAAVVIKNLRKVYRRNRKRVLDGLTTKMFTGEIYVLLGFNGAGKTTTIGILTGLYSPSDGLAHLFDLDIRKDMEEIRRHIGLCPQHNLLYDEMTVVDQVAFFGELKGLGDPVTKATELLEWLGMSDKLKSKPSQLSGGEMRRAHLAIALIGDTKLAFLDEPTSGLDPESRRGVWEILLKLRGKVTIVLTTHNMEEADVLGDRIGIMSEGKMICNGSPTFLKKYYGVGYNLKMSVASPSCDLEKIYHLVRGYVPQAKLINVDYLTNHPPPRNSTISMSIPTAELDLIQVADMMDTLRNDKETLGVDNIGLSLTTMEEVFLKVGEAVQAAGVSLSVADPGTKTVSSSDCQWEDRTLQWYRFVTLVLKRGVYFFHAPFTLISLALGFGVLLWVAVVTFSVPAYRFISADPPLVVSTSSLTSYQSPIILLHDREDPGTLRTLPHNRNFTPAYLSQLQPYLLNPGGASVQNMPQNRSTSEIFKTLKIASLRDIDEYRRRYLAGASFTQTQGVTNITGLFSGYALHSAPLSLNLITQARIKQKYDVDATIEVVNHPFPQSSNILYISLESIAGPGNYFRLCPVVILLVITSSLLIGTAALLPTEERLNKGKQLQLMTGTTPFLYWTAMFLWDFFFFSVVNAGIILVYVLAENESEYWIYTREGETAVFYLILECHLFAALWFCYLISWAPCVKLPADGFLLVNKFAVVVGVLFNVFRHFVVALQIKDHDVHTPMVVLCIYYILEVGSYALYLVPMHSFYLSLIKLAWAGSQNNICRIYPAEVLHLLCDKSTPGQYEEWFVHGCCENCEENCFRSQSSLEYWSLSLLPDYKTHGLVYDLGAMLLCGGICAAVLFTLEYGRPWWLAKRVIKDTSSKSCAVSTKDEDVLEEAARVDEIVKENTVLSANQSFVAQKLSLAFKNFKAVNGISFGVHQGECFGLLGVSGAGKTSTFRMITGDVFPTSGDMFSSAWNCSRDRTSYLSSMGYCPQFDGIIGSLTGLQMVKLYGALRGIPKFVLEEDAKIWLDKFGLLGSANKKCAAYSGGMKRRLSGAMALIGNPKLVLLDEPTTGVDPTFRRQFWKVIREIRERGQSIILTSYTMDECEALCNRLAIMVHGEFKCIGSIPHLKTKFGQGYLLTIRLKRTIIGETPEHEDRVKVLVDLIATKFSPCKEQTKQSALIQYQISKDFWYSDIFRGMVEICRVPECYQVIEDYAVTETTLEDVFIHLAKVDDNNVKTNESLEAEM